MPGISTQEIETARERWIAAPHGQRRKRERALRSAVADELRRELDARAQPAPPAASAPTPVVEPEPEAESRRTPWFKEGQYE